MNTKQAIETMLTSKGIKKKEISVNLGISKPSLTNWLTKLDQVKRLITICNYCEFSLVITNKKGIEIELTLDDDNI